MIGWRWGEKTVFAAAVAALLLIGAVFRAGRPDGAPFSTRLTDFPRKDDRAQFKNIQTEWEIGDDAWIHLVALNLSRGKGISTSVVPPFAPTMFRSPGTSVFAAASYLAVGQKKTKYSFLALFLAGLFVLGLAIRRIFGVLEAACFILTVVFLSSGLWLWKDALCLNSRPLVFFLSAVYLLLLARINDAYAGGAGKPSRLVFGAGVILGALILSRGEFVALPLVTVVLLHLMAAGGGRWCLLRLRQSLSAMGLFLAGLAVVLGPWMIRNYACFGTLSPGGRAGPIVAYKGLAAESVAGGAKYWDFYVRVNLNDFIHEKVNGFVASGGQPSGLMTWEDDQRREGMGLIRKHPGSFLGICWEEFKNGASFNPTRLGFLGRKEDSFVGHYLGGTTFYYFALLSLCGFLAYLWKARLKTLLLFHVAVYYILLNALANAGSGLYTTYVLHLYFAAFSLAVAALTRSLIRILCPRLVLP